MIDLTGQRFGRLTVLHKAQERGKNGNARWLCHCDCGNYKVVDSYLLRNGRTKSCGCLRIDQCKTRALKNPQFQVQMGNVHNLMDDHQHMRSSLTIGQRNKSGVIGVSFDSQHQVWFARLMVKHKYVLLKAFGSFEDAVAARRSAEKQYLED